MKTKAQAILLAFALLQFSAMIGTVSLIGCSGGCAAGKGQLNPATGVYDKDAAASVLVVSVENTRQIALDTFDRFMALEKQNEAALKAINPGIHQAAEEIRRNGRKYLGDLTAAKVRFQQSRSEADATNLKNALVAVNSLLQSAIQHLAVAAKGAP
jgi:hypothetical protein